MPSCAEVSVVTCLLFRELFRPNESMRVSSAAPNLDVAVSVLLPAVAVPSGVQSSPAARFARARAERGIDSAAARAVAFGDPMLRRREPVGLVPVRPLISDKARKRFVAEDGDAHEPEGELKSGISGLGDRSWLTC